MTQMLARAVFAVIIALLSLTKPINAKTKFVKAKNGDLYIEISRLNESDIKQLRKDIPGNQGKCVQFQIREFQEFDNQEAIMRIPSERHGIEFEAHADNVVRVVCGRFSEDNYEYNGDLISSLGYEEIEGYD